ncbi:MAG: hypothetical protein ACRYG5_17010 [Janthinobacterium lividum]
MVPTFDGQIHPAAKKEFMVLQATGARRSIGPLLTLIDEVIDHGLASGEAPVVPVPVPNGSGLYERCAPKLFGVFAIYAPAPGNPLPVLRLLAVNASATAARADAVGRV